MVRHLSEEDWAEIKAEYYANKVSVRELARRRGISDTAIRKKAKEEGWPRRDPKALVVVATSRAKPDPEPAPPPISPTITKAANASHGELVKESRAILQMLAAELRAETVHIGWLEDAIVDYTADDKSPQRYQAMMKAVSLPVRILAGKNLALALKTLEDTSPGKKQQAQDAADTAGEGTEWGDDLNIGAGARAN